MMRDRSNFLILVLSEDVAIEDMEEDMRLYMRTNTYLSRHNRWFWKKLRDAMPQRPLTEIRRELGGNVQEDEDWCGITALSRAIQTLHRVRNECGHNNAVGNGHQQHQHCCQYWAQDAVAREVEQRIIAVNRPEDHIPDAVARELEPRIIALNRQGDPIPLVEKPWFVGLSRAYDIFYKWGLPRVNMNQTRYIV